MKPEIISTFYQKYSKIALINLTLVALIGVIMRYKIGFDFPFFDQKHLQHAHSHFAFGGWVTLGLYLFISHYLEESGIHSKALKKLIHIQLLLSCGMLISFATGGYSLLSIVLSTASVLVSYAYLYLFTGYRKIIHPEVPGYKWYLMALIFQAISSVGTFVLAYMMATHSFHQHTYLASVYFFLHFQYNGWFLFGIIGSTLYFFYSQFKVTVSDNLAFILLSISVFPAFGLSILWMDLPAYLYLIVIAFVILQSIGIILLLLSFWNLKPIILPKLPPIVKWGSIFGGSAYGIKFAMQLASVIPALSHLAFGFRPVVIAYLHLVLLAATSVILLTLLLGQNWLKNNQWTISGFAVLLLGIFLNEAGLGAQGIASFDYIVIPGINLYLFAVSCLILLSLIIINLAQYIKTQSKS